MRYMCYFFCFGVSRRLTHHVYSRKGITSAFEHRTNNIATSFYSTSTIFLDKNGGAKSQVKAHITINALMMRLVSELLQRSKLPAPSNSGS
jgi:hypothetical protein